ncbi:MAG: hypothetical protein WCD18_18160 [Thermosynechococcaceae cyanobacterium]
MTQTLLTQHLSPESIHQLLDHLPDFIHTALLEKASELDCSPEAAVEMAIASFLDAEAFSFEDCLLTKRLKDIA